MIQESVIHTSSSSATPEKYLTCNGIQLRKLTQAALTELDNNHKLVNDLNVFPVPDGDTGTNIWLTMRSAYKRIQDSQETHVGKVANELSQGALMGARGNSGVILSQIWRGLASSLKDSEAFDANDLANALREASDTAYKGVMRPVEGTILTVIREGAEEAQDAIGKSQDLRFLLARVVERCQQALERTPDLLPVLKQAGVVDAGGKGLLVIFEGMLRYVEGELILEAVPAREIEIPAQARAAPAEGLEFPYDVQYILMGKDLDVLAIREDIDAMGDSTVVVGDEAMIKVHVHVKDPGLPLSYGINQGRIDDVVVENMQMQMEAIIGPAGAETPAAYQIDTQLEPGQIGVVAVAAGDGLAEIFRSLGAAGIVNGGQSNNPSTEEIFQIIEQMPVEDVIILPNNKNIILAAEAAGEISGKNVAVIPSRTAPQGISALLALSSKGDLDKAVTEMKFACECVTSGEITVATRSVVLDGVNVEEGQIIGVVNGRLRAAGEDVDLVLQQVLEEMNIESRELVTLYYGQDVSKFEAEEVAAKIEDLHSHLEIEVLPGGQAIYQYILGAE